MKWSVMRSSLSREPPTSLPSLPLILMEEVLWEMLRSITMTGPKTSGSKASCPTLRMLTSTLAKFAPSRMNPLMPFSERLVSLALTPSVSESAVSTALFPDPFSPTRKLMRGPNSTSRLWWHMKLVSFTLRMVPLPWARSTGSGASPLCFFPIAAVGYARGTRSDLTRFRHPKYLNPWRGAQV